MRPPAHLLESLLATRFVHGAADASVGIGERRSRSHGSGLEFAEHRPYREGDDTRHLDARVAARLGENYVRVHTAEKQLPISIIIDGSASMAVGSASKFAMAQRLAQVLAYIGLAGGDQVDIAIFSASKLAWSPRYQGARQADSAFAWISNHSASGAAPFSEGLATAASHLTPGSLTILISDWWDEASIAALDALKGQQHEVIALHLLTPEDEDPSLLGAGSVRLVDGESRAISDVTLDAVTIARYRKALEAWSDALRDAVLRNEGHYMRISADADLDSIFAHDMRASGVIA